MPLEIRRTRALTPGERRSLLEWEEDIFGIDAYGLTWRPWDWSFVGLVGAQPVSHVGALRHTIRVADHPVRVGGIAAVVTVPSARGNGYASQTLRAALAFLGEAGADFGLLFCRDPLRPFYAAMGWQKVDDPVLVEQPPEKIVYPMNVMVLPLTGRTWPSGAVELDSPPW